MFSDKETRMGMCQRINDLRRERIRALATPQAAPFYQEDSMKVVPMSSITERHFWDVFIGFRSPRVTLPNGRMS